MFARASRRLRRRSTTAPSSWVTGVLATLSVLLSVSPPRTASAEINVWTSNGPAGASISALAIDPLAPSTLYAATTTGVFAMQPAAFTVDSIVDADDATPGDGVCATADGVCTLRAAVDESNALPDGSLIAAPAGTYLLTRGVLAINIGVTLRGAGASHTRIDGGGLSQVFSVGQVAADISDVTIQNGRGGADPVGGIENNGHSTLTNVTISGNVGLGGGIANYGALTLTNSTVSGNTGLLNENISGGGIANYGTLALANGTVSGNVGGGGIANFGGTLTITNSTVSNNLDEGGIFNFFGGTLTLRNTIVGDNADENCVGAIISQGHNLDSGASCGFSAVGDLSNTDPNLGPLQDNGGPTFTHALLPGSSAIDAGDDAVTGPPLNLTTDQRGQPRRAGLHVDIGAVESSATSCVGDCDMNGEVTVDELVRGVSIALGNLPLSRCFSVDSNGNHNVTVDELVAAVNDALNGCGRG